MLQSSSNRHMSTSTVQRRLHESGLHGWIAEKKPLLKDTNNKKTCLGQEIRAIDWWKYVLLVWWVQIWDFWFQPLCLCETQSRWTNYLHMCGSHHEAWRCGGDLLVTLSVIYLEFKAHFTSMATTSFCSDTPSPLVCA
jgi:hypothetical protein